MGQASLLAAVSYDGIALPAGGEGYLANTGIWRSTDGGTVWSQVKADASKVANCGCFRPDFGTDVIFDTAHPGVAYAALGDALGYTETGFTSQANVYVSADSGATWAPFTSAPFPGNNSGIGRIALSLTSDGQHLVALLAGSGANGTTTGALVGGNLYSGAVTIGGSAPYSPSVTWTSTTPGLAGISDNDGTFQWLLRPTVVAFDPTDSREHIYYLGGVDIWKTTDAGANWWRTSPMCYGANPGPRPSRSARAGLYARILVVLPGKRRRSLEWHSGGTFTDLNAELNITQFYAGSVSDVGASPSSTAAARITARLRIRESDQSRGVAQWNVR